MSAKFWWKPLGLRGWYSIFFCYCTLNLGNHIEKNRCGKKWKLVCLYFFVYDPDPKVFIYKITAWFKIFFGKTYNNLKNVYHFMDLNRTYDSQYFFLKKFMGFLGRTCNFFSFFPSIFYAVYLLQYFVCTVPVISLCL